MSGQSLIDHFYSSFASADVEGMLGCYSESIQFEDPAFGKLYNNDVSAMWRMLLKNPDIKISFGNIHSDDKTGSADWTAIYTFSRTGRKVTNKVSAYFEFENGKIIKHIDRFNSWKWAGQALGIKGWLLGWTPFMQKKIRKMANAALTKYKDKK